MSSDTYATEGSARVVLPDWAYPLSDFVFRGLFSLIFLIAGLGHFVQADVMIQRLVDGPLGGVATSIAPAPLLISVTGVVLVAAGLLLLLGFKARIAALALMAVLIPITGTVHLAPGPEHMGPLFKNVALMGGLLHFIVRGAGAFSLDRRGSNGIGATL